MRKRREKRLLTQIFLVSAALMVALTALGPKLFPKDISVEAKEAYPNLYAETKGVFQAPDQPTVYFTFDDGPSKNTRRLLDILKEENVKATFFVTGQDGDPEEAKELLCRMRDEGHTIGLHTYSHDYSDVYKCMDNYLADLDKLNTFIIECTGVRPVVMRHPGGSRTQNCSQDLMKQIAEEVSRRGYIFHDWTVVSGDDTNKAKAVETLTGNILKGIQGRQMEVLLFHDNATPTTTPDAVAALITELRRQGYQFDRITETTPPYQAIWKNK